MTVSQILLAALKLGREELPLLDAGLHAIMGALESGQTEQEAVEAARAAMETLLDQLENAESPKK